MRVTRFYMKRPAKIRGYLLNLVPTLEIFWALLKTANRTADRTMLSSGSLEHLCRVVKELTQRVNPLCQQEKEYICQNFETMACDTRKHKRTTEGTNRSCPAHNWRFSYQCSDLTIFGSGRLRMSLNESNSFKDTKFEQCSLQQLACSRTLSLPP